MTKQHILAILILCGVLGLDRCEAQSKQKPPKMDYAIVIHGGAGRAPTSDEWRTNRERVLKQALETGMQMLKDGRSSLDTVEAVIQILENSPYFNAGKGAVFNAKEQHELDASIMDGRTRSCGAVGGVRTIRNPISLARLVMTETRHVLLVSDGAEKFADELSKKHDVARVPNEYFSTEHQRAKLRKVQESRGPDAGDAKGTVGCVALDRDGNLAAGTSTGGLVDKKFGRIGDSPIVGAGTYADNRTCGVSCTGVGEDYIRHAVAYDVSARMAYSGASLHDAARAILNHPEHQVRGGIIAVDKEGAITMQFNTPGMARAAADSSGRLEIHLGK